MRLVPCFYLVRVIRCVIKTQCFYQLVNLLSLMNFCHHLIPFQPNKKNSLKYDFFWSVSFCNNSVCSWRSFAFSHATTLKYFPVHSVFLFDLLNLIRCTISNVQVLQILNPKQQAENQHQKVYTFAECWRFHQIQWEAERLCDFSQFFVRQESTFENFNCGLYYVTAYFLKITIIKWSGVTLSYQFNAFQ